MLFASMRYFSFDPIKRALFLVFSLLGLLPVISCNLYVWYSYYVCLLFLSGIFVIIVYFSRIGFCEVFSLDFFSFLLCVYFRFFCMSFDLYDYGGMGLGLVVSDIYLVYYFWLVGVLLFYLNFISSFLTFIGALRSF